VEKKIMAKGNEIIVNGGKGTFHEGKINGTPKPGTCMQIKATAFSNGKPEWEVFNRAADGDRALIAILLPDHFQGKTADDAYADGDWGEVYCPVNGEELNILFLNQAGTADDIAIGDYAIVDDGTGKFIKTTGSPQSEPFVFLEAFVDPTADKLLHAMFTGM